MGKLGIALAEAAADASAAAIDLAGGAVDVASGAAVVVHQAANDVVEGVRETAARAAGMVGSGIEAVKDNSKERVAFRAKRDGFKDGLNEGAALMADKLLARTYALLALGLCMARCDGELSEEELAEIRDDAEHLLSNRACPPAVRMEVYAMVSNDALSFDDVEPLLDKLDCETLLDLRAEIEAIAEADGKVTREEEALLARYGSYVRGRVDADPDLVIDLPADGAPETGE